MNGDSSNSRERLKNLLYACFEEALSEVVRNSLWYNRIPAFLVDGDSLFEARKKEMALVEVSE